MNHAFWLHCTFGSGCSSCGASTSRHAITSLQPGGKSLSSSSSKEVAAIGLGTVSTLACAMSGRMWQDVAGSQDWNQWVAGCTDGCWVGWWIWTSIKGRSTQKRMPPEYDELIKNKYTSGCIHTITHIPVNVSKMDGYRRRE